MKSIFKSRGFIYGSLGFFLFPLIPIPFLQPTLFIIVYYISLSVARMVIPIECSDFVCGPISDFGGVVVVVSWAIISIFLSLAVNAIIKGLISLRNRGKV